MEKYFEGEKPRLKEAFTRMANEEETRSLEDLKFRIEMKKMDRELEIAQKLGTKFEDLPEEIQEYAKERERLKTEQKRSKSLKNL